MRFADNESRIGLTVAVEDSQLLQEMIATGQAISVTDVRQDRRFTSLLEPEYLSWLGIPLISKSKVTGVIALEKTTPNAYSTEHIQAATTFSSQAAIALENAFLFEDSVRRAAELDQRSQRLALLNRFSGELGASLDFNHILRLTIQQACSALSATHALIVMIADSGKHLVYEEQTGQLEFHPEELPLTQVIEASDRISGYLSRQRRDRRERFVFFAVVLCGAPGAVIIVCTAGSRFQILWLDLD
jgi:GAF domain-containing protein